MIGSWLIPLSVADPRRRQFNALLSAAIYTQQYLYAPGTAKNIKSHIRTFLIFCAYFNRAAVPADTDTLVAFAEFMSVTVGYQHIKHIFSSIKLLHTIYNIDFLEYDFRVDTALQSLKRRLAKTPLRVLPMTPDILRSLYLFLDMSKPQDQALWASFLVAFFCMFRKKSLVPESFSKFDPKLGLSRKKVGIHKDRGCAFIYTNFAKNIQFAEKDIVIPLLHIPDDVLCPVTAIHKLITNNPVSYDAPLFSYLQSGRTHCITYSLFTTRLKQLLSQAGYSPDLYSGHSFRRGGASFLYSLGADPIMIKFSGDWLSDSYLNYVSVDLSSREHAQKMMVAALSS